MEFDVWITQYALTKGIIKRRAVRCDRETMISVVKRPGEMTWYIHKPHWWESEKEAKARVVEMATAKLKSLERQTKRLKQILNEPRD